MVKSKTYYFKNEVLDYGFVLSEEDNSSINFDSIINSISESIILVDTKGLFLYDALDKMSLYLNQDAKLLIGLTSKELLSKLKERGIKNGFFRSTNDDFETGVIVVDKKDCYIALDINHIYRIKSNCCDEIFKYVNHIIWSKTDFEVCQGNISEVKETRLSVVMPSFIEALKPNVTKKYSIATEDIEATSDIVIVKKEDVYSKRANLTKHSISAFEDNGYLNIKLFLDNYYPTEALEDNLYIGKSFENAELFSLESQNIWYKNRNVFVKSSDTVSETKFVPLDKVQTFSPDFDEIIKKYDELALKIEVNVDVRPIKLDGSYALSPKYKVIAKAENDLAEGVAKLKKMELEEGAAKQLDSIEGEHNLPLKIKMYNAFVSDKEFGVGALNNKKGINTININADDLVVPNELIGKLYTKNNQLYFATSFDYMNEAMEWLKENKTEAVLIER